MDRRSDNINSDIYIVKRRMKYRAQNVIKVGNNVLNHTKLIIYDRNYKGQAPQTWTRRKKHVYCGLYMRSQSSATCIQQANNDKTTPQHTQK